MNEHDAENLRQAIAKGQGWGTRCYCGATVMEFCADDRAWLIEHSPRIERSWRWWSGIGLATYRLMRDVRAMDAAEADRLAYYEAGR